MQKILKTKNYYAIFGVEKTAKEDEIKRAYKKLALKLHPDKNGAPNAEEAFKKVSKAIQCLTDERKRQIYDTYGDEERAAQAGAQQYQETDFMSANDFFEAFFNGGAPQQRRRQHDPDGDMQRQHLFQLLPLLFVLLTAFSPFSLFNNAPQRKFSWQREGNFPIVKTSKRLAATYYVSKSFDKDYPPHSRQKSEFENALEMDYIRNAQSECEYQERQMWRRVMVARRNTDPTLRSIEVEKAKAVPRKSCEKVEKIKAKNGALFRAAQGYFGEGEL